LHPQPQSLKRPIGIFYIFYREKKTDLKFASIYDI
jgi:hypothetical protein